MRVYVTDSGDTLKRIAEKCCVDLSELMSLNPQLSFLNQLVSGIPVYLPSITRSPLPSSSSPISKGTWIQVTSPEKMSLTEYDAIIVGTGAGGGAALWRLCEQWKGQEKKIGIVEAGDLLIPTNAHNIETLEGEKLPEYYLDVSNLIEDRFREVIALGGRTLFWNGVAPRMNLYTNGEWPVPEQEMDHYYSIAEQVMNVTRSFADESPLNQLFLDRLWNSNFTHAMNMPFAVNLRKSKYGVIHSNVCFSSISFLAKAFNLKQFDLAIKTRAVKVLTEENKVTGVRVMTLDKRSYVLKAKTIVLSASTVETPRLLLHSGIPGRAIGHYLTDHTFPIARAKLNPMDNADVSGTVAILIPQTSGQPYQVEIVYPDTHLWYHDVRSLLREPLELLLKGVGTVLPRFENKIMLNPEKKDTFGVPEARIHMTYSKRDHEVIRQTEKAVKDLASVLDVPVISTKSTTVPTIGVHASGTCRMGDDPSTSATNRYGQIHGVSGLYVADNSMIPVLGAANPTLTTVALSIRVADHIAGHL